MIGLVIKVKILSSIEDIEFNELPEKLGIISQIYKINQFELPYQKRIHMKLQKTVMRPLRVALH